MHRKSHHKTHRTRDCLSASKHLVCIKSTWEVPGSPAVNVSERVCFRFCWSISGHERECDFNTFISSLVFKISSKLYAKYRSSATVDNAKTIPWWKADVNVDILAAYFQDSPKYDHLCLCWQQAAHAMELRRWYERPSTGTWYLQKHARDQGAQSLAQTDIPLVVIAPSTPSVVSTFAWTMKN